VGIAVELLLGLVINLVVLYSTGELGLSHWVMLL
jgi:hypothetical protein